MGYGLHRRRFLRGIGGLAATLPIAAAFSKSRRTQAGEGSAPVRFLAVCTYHGTLRDYWIPKTAGGAAPSAADMALSDLTFDYDNAILSPLEPWKNQITVLDGLDHAVVSDIEPGYGGHERCCTALTGYGIPEGPNRPGGPSLDHFLKSRLGPEAGRQLVLGVESADDHRALSFGDTGGANVAQLDPRGAFDDLFPGGGGGSPTMPDTTAAERLALRASVLDQSIEDVARLRDLLSGDERIKLEAHLDGLRDLESTLAPPGMGPTPVDCGDPMFVAGGGSGPTGVENQVASMASVIAQAFACNHSRIATLNITGDWHNYPMEISAQTRLGEVDTGAGYHNSITHGVHGSDTGDAMTQVYTTGQRWFSEHFARVLSALDIPDPAASDSSTILDNTVIYWTNELGIGGHADDFHSMPIIVAGGGGGRIRSGRYLRLRDPDSRTWVPHNRALTSIANVMGLDDVEYFGDPRARDSSAYRGPLSELMV